MSRTRSSPWRSCAHVQLCICTYMHLGRFASPLWLAGVGGGGGVEAGGVEAGGGGGVMTFYVSRYTMLLNLLQFFMLMSASIAMWRWMHGDERHRFLLRLPQETGFLLGLLKARLCVYRSISRRDHHVSFHVMIFQVIPCHYHIISHHVVSCHLLSFQIMSCHETGCFSRFPYPMLKPVSCDRRGDCGMFASATCNLLLLPA